MIEIDNLKKSFNGELIWQNVTFCIEEGEAVAIIGRSGSGKSVLVKHFNALLYPDSGYVNLDGNCVFDMAYSELRKMRQRFGILFQGSALFDSINTFENIAFPLRYFTDQTEQEIRKNVEEALALVNLKEAGNKDTSELSGGMRKRVALARAIILRPDYLIYDEPTAGLDPQTSDEINQLITSLSDNLNITSIVVTHDIHSVLEIADKVAFLENKTLCWYGSVEEMKTSTNEDLRAFIKASEYTIN